MAGKLELVTTSSDASALAALEHARTYHAMWRDFIPLPPAADGDDAESSPGFASGNWRRAVAGRRHPGVVVRRHFQAMVFTYLAGNCAPGTLRWPAPGSTPTGASTCCPGQGASRPGGVCAEVALPGTAAGFAERLRHAHLNAPAGLDAGYEANAGLVIGEGGVPARKRRRGAGTPQAAGKVAGRSRGGCRSRRSCRSWRAPPAGWAGTTISARLPARIPRAVIRWAGTA